MARGYVTLSWNGAAGSKVRLQVRNMAVTERDKFSEDLFCPCGLLSKYFFFFFFRLGFYSRLER